MGEKKKLETTSCNLCQSRDVAYKEYLDGDDRNPSHSNNSTIVQKRRNRDQHLIIPLM